MSTNKMNIVKRIAIVAHDSSKNDLIEWSFHNREVLNRHNIIATGYAADVLEGTLNMPVNKLTAGLFGGYAQLGAMINDGKVDAIIFLGYPKKTTPADSDMKSLLQLAEENNLVIALNERTADVILTSAFLNETFAHASLEKPVERKVV
jgi:methylglyoxal synthase